MRYRIPFPRGLRRTRGQAAARCGTPCPVCVSGVPVRLRAYGERDLLICPECRHVFWATMPSDEELELYYRERYSDDHDQSATQRGVVDYYRGHVAEIPGRTEVPASDCTLVDFGCSIPYLLLEAKAAGYKGFIGVDFDSKARDFGEKHGITVMTPSEFLRTVPDGSVDVVRFSHALEHLIRPRETLAEMAVKIRVGGWVYVTQPNVPVFKAEPHDVDVQDPLYPEHLHFFSAISLCRLVRDARLSVRVFFTHQNADDVWRKCHMWLDTAHTARALADAASIGAPKSFGPACNYPLYLGENSVLWAVKDR